MHLFLHHHETCHVLFIHLSFLNCNGFQAQKRSLNVEKDSVDPSDLIIAYSNVMNTTICKLTIGFRSTLEANLSSSSLKPTQLDDVHIANQL